MTPVLSGGCCVLVTTGELDGVTVPTLEKALGACTDGLPVIVDLTRVTFVESAGLHALMQPRPYGQPAALVRLPGSHIARVLDIVNAGEAVPIFDDQPTAVERSRRLALPTSGGHSRGELKR